MYLRSVLRHLNHRYFCFRPIQPPKGTPAGWAPYRNLSQTSANMVLDLELFREDKGGCPDKIKENQTKRFKDVKLVDAVLDEDEGKGSCRRCQPITSCWIRSCREPASSGCGHNETVHGERNQSDPYVHRREHEEV